MAKAGKPRRYSESKGILSEGISGELQRLRHDEFGIKEAQQAAPVMPPRTRHGLHAPTPDPVSEPEESSGEDYAQSDEEVEENVEGASEEESGDDFLRPRDTPDPRFHTALQKTVYEQVYAGKAFAEHKWISWRDINETPEFESLHDLFKIVGIDWIVTLKQDYNEDLIRQFYVTVWVARDYSEMKWMSDTLQCSISRRQFRRLLNIHLDFRDDLHEEHTHNPLSIDYLSQFYEDGVRYTHEKVDGLRTIPSVVNRIVRATILPRLGNNDDIRGVAWHVIDAIIQGRQFDIVSLMMQEIAISKRTFTQGIYYAPYIMRLIQDKLGAAGQNLKKNKQYKPRLQLGAPRAPRTLPSSHPGASSSSAPPPPHGYDPNAFFHPQYAYFGMQPNEYFNPVLGAINTLSESIQRLSTGHEALHEDVRGLRTNVGDLNASVGRLHTRVGVLDS
uniref:Uncharacterized protein n=1 Tax=Oryza sativa subsp. japonica TaxID=39947 RepID=Q84SR4_ORYSJ|nr:hypothetical protein [Oryza sativa Japonica Group]